MKLTKKESKQRRILIEVIHILRERNGLKPITRQAINKQLRKIGGYTLDHYAIYIFNLLR